MHFYQRLAGLRKDAGLSQEQLAEKAGVSRQTIFKWEAGLASRLWKIFSRFAVFSAYRRTN